jgi:hypothetical protein
MIAKGSLEWDIIPGQVAGYRMQGKPRMCWLDSIKEANGLGLESLKETVQDRFGTGNAPMCNERRRRQWQTTPEQQILPRKSSIGSPGV